jgi:hypothetical protein
MVDNKVYVDIKFFKQHDSWNNILKCGMPYVEQPVYKIVTAFCENSMSLVQRFIT